MDEKLNTIIAGALLRRLEQSGADLERFFQGSNLPRDFLAASHNWISVEELLGLFARAREQTGDDRIAYETGRALIESRKQVFSRHALVSKNIAKTMRNIFEWLAPIYPLARAKLTPVADHRMRVEVFRNKECRNNHDLCLFFQGVLDAVLIISGCLPRKSEELICVRAPEPAEQSAGTRYGGSSCVYELQWEDLRPLWKKLWGKTVGALLELARTLLALEKSPVIDGNTYQQVCAEWQRWIGWEDSYGLTKAKYLAYAGFLALSALPLAGHFFDEYENYLFKGFSNLWLSAAILLFGMGMTSLQLRYARKLHRHKEQSEQFMQQAGVGVTMIDKEYNVVFANQLILNVYGNVMDKKCHQAFRLQSSPCPECALGKVFSTKEQSQVELKNIDRFGRERWFYAIFSPIFDQQGRVSGVLEISTDITEKKSLEAELARQRADLEASEHKYRNFMANAADAILITDLNGGLIEASNQFHRMLELSDEKQAHGPKLLDSLTHGTAEKQKLALITQAMIKDGQPREFELRLQCRSGKNMEAEVRAILLLRNREPAWMQFILRDITERKRHELQNNLMLSISMALKDAPSLQELLDQSLKGICAIMEVPIAAIFIKDPERPELHLAAQVGRSSEAIRHLARVAIDDAAGANNIASRTAILNRPIVVPDVHQLKMDAQTRQRVDMLGVTSMICMPMVMEQKLQGVIQIATRDTRFFDDDKIGILTQMANELAVGIARQRLRDALEESNRQLLKKHQELENATLQLLQNEKMASIGQLAAGIAHEINNPMGFINANLNVLEDYRRELKELFTAYDQMLAKFTTRNLDRNEAELLRNLKTLAGRIKADELFNDFQSLIRESREGAERVKKIILNLGEFSHPDRGKLEYADLNAGLDSTLNIVWNELKYKAEVKKEYSELPKIRCYPQEMNQVFMNLLVNAAQAIPEKGEIRIKTWREDGHVMISIADTGTGIPGENLKKIFDPFFTTKEVGKGTGLGLSISYGIVKKHNGEITVNSEPGKGATFTVRLPINGQIAVEKDELPAKASGA